MSPSSHPKGGCMIKKAVDRGEVTKYPGRELGKKKGSSNLLET